MREGAEVSKFVSTAPPQKTTYLRSFFVTQWSINTIEIRFEKSFIGIPDLLRLLMGEGGRLYEDNYQHRESG